MEGHLTKSGGGRGDEGVVRACREIVRAWRRLTTPAGERRAGGGAPTLVACSGGADSAALAIALATATDTPIVLGHVVHDLRPEGEALADRDAVRELAARLGCGFVERRVVCRREGGRHGNLEAVARRLRYAALAEMAAEGTRAGGLGFVATGHQATDQLETVLMGLMRGAGPRGLAGVRERRVLRRGDVLSGEMSGARDILLIRPMLGVTREDSEAICRGYGWAWREDATNADTTRLRAALRHRVLPILREIRPGVELRAAGAADLLREAAGLIDDESQGLFEQAKERTPQRVVWARGDLRGAMPIVLGETLRSAAASLAGGAGADRISQKMVRDAVRAIRDASGETRRFAWGEVVVVVSKADVSIVRG